jgi:hypothetical protein
MAFMTPHGVFLPGWPGRGFVYHRLHDAAILTNVHMTTALLPAVIWAMSVLSRWEEQAHHRQFLVTGMSATTSGIPLLSGALAAGAGAGALLTNAASGNTRRHSGAQSMAARAAGCASAAPLSCVQVLVVALLLPLHVKLMSKIAASYGWPSVVLAPATGWLVPLAAAWLYIAWRGMQARSRRSD